MPSEKRDRLREALEWVLCIGSLELSSTDWLRSEAVAIAHAVVNMERRTVENWNPMEPEWEDCEDVDDVLVEVFDAFFPLAAAAEYLAHSKESAFVPDAAYSKEPLWYGGPTLEELAKCNRIEPTEVDNA